MRAHLFVCMLAYYVEWHMRQRLAPLLFAEEGGPPGRAGAGGVGAAVRGGAAQGPNSLSTASTPPVR